MPQDLQNVDKSIETKHEEYEYELTRFDKFCIALERSLVFGIPLFLAGVITFFFNTAIACDIIGISLIHAGLVPIISGTYRGPFGVLLGAKARLRGSVSLLLGLAMLALGIAQHLTP